MIPGYLFWAGWLLLIASMVAYGLYCFDLVPAAVQLCLVAASLACFGAALAWPRRWTR